MPVNIGTKKCKLYMGNTKIRKGYLGTEKVYSCGNVVTYCVDSGVSYTEEVDEGASCLSPKTFTPAKSGWEFAGWRQDKTASGSVLSSLSMGDTPVTLYAVFRQTITLSYNGNGNTGGTTAAQTGNRYYNNGGISNPAFKLSANGFNKTGYVFSKWAMSSAGGTQYAAGASVTLAANTVMYAVWTAEAFTLTLDGSGWTEPAITQGGWSDGPKCNTAFNGGVEFGGIGATSLPFATAEIHKTINTKGLPKATITFENGSFGSLHIGDSQAMFINETSPLTISIATSPTTQILKLSVNNGGDTYNNMRVHVYNIYFHN